MPETLRLADDHFRIRPAQERDVDDITDVFYHSFNAPFFQYFSPDKPGFRRWFTESWRIGINNPTDVTFVVEDTSLPDHPIVAFSRWMIPQTDGNQERKWPEMSDEGWDFEVVEKFFGGMEENRHILLEKRPHWFLEMLGVRDEYQKLGIGAKLIKWGTDQADRDGLETYLDGSEIGQPYYVRRHHFEIKRDIAIPDRPQYGSYAYKSLVRPPQKVEE